MKRYYKKEYKENTIMLVKGEIPMSQAGYEKYERGDLFNEDFYEKEEIKRWKIEDKAEAHKELEKYSYEYDSHHGFLTDYVLEYCMCDDEGEFIEGSSYWW